MSRVLLVNMPFGNVRWPHLGLGLLKAALGRRQVACDVAYFNFDFAELVGVENYHWLADHFAFVLGGERLFARHYFREKGDRHRLCEAPEGPFRQTVPVPLFSDADYYRQVLLASDPEMTEADHAAFLDTARCIEPFLEKCVAAVDWSRYDVVGLTASFQQTMSSVCLAQRIKRLRPETTIVFGGAACEGCMGPELLRHFPEIDRVFSGEADLTFPDAVQRWMRGEGRGHKGCEGCDGMIVEDLDALPYPDFDDYFTRLERSPLRAEIDPLLFFETSRGCWWGAKHRCKFCGLNGARLGFRSKSPDRVVNEMRYLVGRHRLHRACAADNVLDPAYFKSLLPMLADAGLDLSLVFEMKTNLTRQQVEILKRAGLAAAQLGIETLSTPVLNLIGKGATAMQNLQALRWFCEAGVEAKWNLLYGFPGEDPAEYAEMAELMPSLCHLAPPQIAGRVRVDRFAPYFDHPERHGLVNLRPTAGFRYVYPFAPEELARLAYYFDYDYADGRNPLDYARPAIEAVARWQQIAGTVALCYWDRPDGVLLITDSRPSPDDFRSGQAADGFAPPRQHRLTGVERSVYLFCDTGRTVKQIVEHTSADQSTIQRILGDLVESRLMARLDGRYLSLALQVSNRAA